MVTSDNKCKVLLIFNMLFFSRLLSFSEKLSEGMYKFEFGKSDLNLVTKALSSLCVVKSKLAVRSLIPRFKMIASGEPVTSDLEKASLMVLNLAPG